MPQSLNLTAYIVRLLHASIYPAFPQAAPTGDYALTKAWEVFFATPFNNHHVDGKSRRRKYRADVRELLLDLEKQQARKYPVKDLVKLNLKLGPALGEYPPKKSR